MGRPSSENFTALHPHNTVIITGHRGNLREIEKCAVSLRMCAICVEMLRA